MVITDNARNREIVREIVRDIVRDIVREILNPE